MSYAVRRDGKGWRAVNSSEECAPEEIWQEATPSPIEPPLLTLQDRIDAFVRQTSSGRIQNELQLEGLTAGLLGVHLASGGTEPQLYASNSAYRQAKQLRAAVANMRAQG